MSGGEKLPPPATLRNHGEKTRSWHLELGFLLQLIVRAASRHLSELPSPFFFSR